MKVQRQVLLPQAPEGCLRIAFATSDGATVNDHFGWGMDFLLFDVNQAGFKKSGQITFVPEEKDEAEHSERNFVKAEALAHCHIVYAAAIGGPVAAKLTQRKIQPMVVKEEAKIETLLHQFQTMLAKPPLWIQKLIGKEDPNRFDAFEEDEE